MTYKIADLRRASDAALIEQHDEVAEHATPGVDYHLNELRRRDVARSERTIRRLTWAIAVMTAAVLVATVLNLLVFLADQAFIAF